MLAFTWLAVGVWGGVLGDTIWGWDFSGDIISLHDGGGVQVTLRCSDGFCDVLDDMMDIMGL